MNKSLFLLVCRPVALGLFLSFPFAFFVATINGQGGDFLLFMGHAAKEAYFAVNDTAVRFTKIVKPDPFDKQLLHKQLNRLSASPDPFKKSARFSGFFSHIIP